MFVSDKTVGQNEYNNTMTSKYPNMVPEHLYIIRSSNNCVRVKQDNEYGTMYFGKESDTETNDSIGMLVKFIEFDYCDGLKFVDLTYVARNCEFENSVRFYISETEFANLKVEDVTNNSEISDFGAFRYNKIKLDDTVHKMENIIDLTAITLLIFTVIVGMVTVLGFLPRETKYLVIFSFIAFLICGIGSRYASRLMYCTEIDDMRKTRKHNNHQYAMFITNRSVLPKFMYYPDEYRAVFYDKNDQEFYNNEKYYVEDYKESYERSSFASTYDIL